MLPTETKSVEFHADTLNFYGGLFYCWIVCVLLISVGDIMLRIKQFEYIASKENFCNC